MPYPTMITAHAGAEGTRANTLESICAMMDMGADALEIDVRMRDGRIFLSHDPLQEGMAYPSLEDCFALIAECPRLLVNVDLKEEGLAAAAADIAWKSGMAGRFLFTGSVGDEDISYVKAHGLTVWYNGALLPPDTPDPVTAVQDRGFQVLNTHYRLVTDRMLAQTPQRLSIWTVKDEELMVRYLEAGAKNITTRSPLMALELRRQIQG